MSALTDKLEQLGFTRNDDAAAYFSAVADQQGMDKGGPYTQSDVFTRGDVFVVVERNTGDEDLGGLEATVRYPAVAILESPRGRIAFSPDDIGLAERLIADLG